MLGLLSLLPTGTYMAPLDKFLFLCKSITQFNPPTAIVSLIGLGWLIGARLVKTRVKGAVGRVLRYLPEIFVLVVVATGEFTPLLSTVESKCNRTLSRYKSHPPRALRRRCAWPYRPRQRLAFRASACSTTTQLLQKNIPHSGSHRCRVSRLRGLTTLELTTPTPPGATSTRSLLPRRMPEGLAMPSRPIAN